MMQDLTDRDLKGFWSTFLAPSLSSRIAKGLKETGFKCLNKDSPEEYTKVRVLVRPENVKKIIVLAFDKNLNSLAPESDSDDRKNAIKQILSAKTLNDVLPFDIGGFKMSYRKMLLKVHPTKNSHPKATDALKKLNDAFERLSTGSRGSEPALKITSTPSRLTRKPPKVISVTDNFTKVCTVTMVTEKDLDIRAYLNSFDKQEDELSERIRNVLNNCWENMDAEGGIADPDSRTGLKFEMVEQVQDRIYFAKEVIFQGKPEILEVCFYNKMRMKVYGDDWKESQEIEINFGESSSSFTGERIIMIVVTFITKIIMIIIDLIRIQY
ncbi:uncharacterized protein LOC111703709 [Eurytemora carolleeae]|uniref:uncharacterized protein LOC111703709 n=1 Tax=Eurytemora carolleeae TaxID=1294199 RepID=UPI000C765C77|nr:uncharacterized protein LOC111703709 [Eurytemora carolleeae]|eukprot:XP_023331505.1 uncharacterized protein LOC111703709 [Eurytemora affinis]